MENVIGLGGVGAGLSLFAGVSVFALVVWSIIWKGLALWKAARREDKWWFIVLLVVNTVGILEILYIYIWNKRPVAGSTPVSAPENKV